MSGRMTIAVGLSGGVDSSVAAALLKEEGHRVIGLTMAIYDPSLGIVEGPRHACFGPGEDEDIAACRRISESLGIPYHVIDLRAEYKAQVLDYFRREYLAGRTPNPCVRCNSSMKFGFLLSRAREAGIAFDAFATGHYARIGQRHGRICLLRGADKAKDQSYFIFRLSARQLEGIRFPLGGMAKSEVRSLARRFGLETAEEPESQDFIGGGDYSPVFKDSRVEAGDIVDDAGKVIGRHRGIVHYTIGQRRGLGVSSAEPLYVSKIDAARNRVVLSPDKALYARGLVAHDVFLQDPDERSFRAEARIRNNHRPAPCTAEVDASGALRVIFDEQQRGIAPGQSVVLYDGDAVAGGGTMTDAIF